jgi:hypothetical protein
MTSRTGSNITNTGRMYESVSVHIKKCNKLAAGQYQECVKLCQSQIFELLKLLHAEILRYTRIDEVGVYETTVNYYSHI